MLCVYIYIYIYIQPGQVGLVEDFLVELPEQCLHIVAVAIIIIIIIIIITIIVISSSLVELPEQCLARGRNSVCETKTILLGEPLPCKPSAESAIQPLSWCSKSLYSL